VANQLTVIENGVNKRPDVVLFVNGLPLVVIELKNAADENASVKSAYKQLLQNGYAVGRQNQGQYQGHKYTRSPVFPVVRYRNSLWRFR
jgi:type I site-specific restriction-modification system R (restriction) subunit